VDLLPRGTISEEVIQWLNGAAVHKRLSPIATYLVSSRTGAHAPLSCRIGKGRRELVSPESHVLCWPQSSPLLYPIVAVSSSSVHLNCASV
jgi:hypothetical protein